MLKNKKKKMHQFQQPIAIAFPSLSIFVFVVFNITYYCVVVEQLLPSCHVFWSLVSYQPSKSRSSPRNSLRSDAFGGVNTTFNFYAYKSYTTMLKYIHNYLKASRSCHIFFLNIIISLFWKIVNKYIKVEIF